MKIHQIPLIWWYITLSFSMSIIVEVVYSSPTKNTHSQKWLYPAGPHNQHLQDGMAILDTRYYFFTLPNMMDDDKYVHLVQQNTCLFDLQDMDHEELTDHKRRKKNWVRVNKMKRMRIEVEKLVRLKRELRWAHKKSITEAGEQGIIWWNQEYWDTGKGLKRIGGVKMKKEEPLTPSLQIKVKPSPTSTLQYPPSHTSTSRFRSIDPNKFVWSLIYMPSPYWKSLLWICSNLWASGIC